MNYHLRIGSNPGIMPGKPVVRGTRIALEQIFRKLSDSLSRPRRFFETGRSPPEFPDLPFREVIVFVRRFFYRVKNDTAKR